MTTKLESVPPNNCVQATPDYALVLFVRQSPGAPDAERRTMRPAITILLAYYLCGCAAQSGSISASTRPPEDLVNRAYCINMESFWPEFEKLTHVEEQIQAKTVSLKSTGIRTFNFNSQTFFQAAFAKLLKDKEQVSFQPPTAVFMNERLGKVLVLGTSRQCEAVERLLSQLNGQPRVVGNSQ